MKNLLIISGSLLLALELGGRYWGFCDYPLYQEHPAYEHIHQSQQDRLIYRNHFLTNSWSLRSAALRSSDRIRILLAGDSILNGGNLTDQNDLATTQLENQLQATFGQEIRILNLSGPNWGPDNIAAYLELHGEAIRPDALWLITSSHDAFDAMQFEQIIGRHPQYPNRQAPLAIIKLAQRIWHHFFKVRRSHQQQIEDSAGRPFNPGFAQLKSWCDKQQIPMQAYLHWSQPEIQRGQLHRGGQLILQTLDSLHVPVLNEQNNLPGAALFRDELHYNAQGQAFLAEQLLPHLTPQITALLQIN